MAELPALSDARPDACACTLLVQDLRVTAMCVHRVISDDKESSSGKDDRGKLKTMKRKVVQLFGMTDKEEENQAADFEEDDALDALEQEEEERAEAQEQEKEGEDDADLDKEQLLYWEVRLRPTCPTCPARAARTQPRRMPAHSRHGQAGTHTPFTTMKPTDSSWHLALLIESQ